MGEPVKFYRSTGAKIAQHPIENGALYFATDETKTFMDVGGERLTIYEPHDSWSFEEMGKPIIPYLTFESEDGSDFTFSISSPYSRKNWNGILEYSTDLENWSTYTTVGISINSINGLLYLRGSNNTHLSTGTSSYSTIALDSETARIKCLGNIETLLDWQTVANGEHPNMDNRCFLALFKSCTQLMIPPSLPATELKLYCYQTMFSNCSNLIALPRLPGILKTGCYYHMFDSCSLIKVSTVETDEYSIPYPHIVSSGMFPSDPTEGMFANTGGDYTGNFMQHLFLSNTNFIIESN